MTPKMKIIMVGNDQAETKQIKEILKGLGLNNVNITERGQPTMEYVINHYRANGHVSLMICSSCYLCDEMSKMKEILKSKQIDFPVLFITSRDRQDDLAKVMEDGYDNVLFKPYSQGDLIGMLNTIFQGI